MQHYAATSLPRLTSELGDRVTVTTCICISYKYLGGLSTPHILHNMNGTAASEAGLLGLYDHLVTDLRDPRVDSWPLMASPWPTVSLCGLYYFIVR